MALIGKDTINKSVDRKWEDVHVPEWGGDVRILELSSADRGYLEAGSLVANGSTPQFKVESIKNNREKVVAMALVDENFERLFTNKEITDLGKKSGKVLDRLYQVAMRISGMSPGSVDDAEGNSVAVQSGSSDSD